MMKGFDCPNLFSYFAGVCPPSERELFLYCCDTNMLYSEDVTNFFAEPLGGCHLMRESWFKNTRPHIDR